MSPIFEPIASSYLSVYRTKKKKFPHPQENKMKNRSFFYLKAVLIADFWNYCLNTNQVDCQFLQIEISQLIGIEAQTQAQH